MKTAIYFITAAYIAAVASPALASESPQPTATPDTRPIEFGTCKSPRNTLTAASPYSHVLNQITHARDDLICLRNGIPDDINTQHNWQTFFDSSTIGLGIGSAIAAFARATSPVVGGLAIAASGLAQYRGYYNPEKLGAGYMKAEHVTRCAITQSERLISSDVAPLYQAMHSLALSIDALSQAENRLTTATITEPASESKVQAAATSARTAAQNAYGALSAQTSAYSLAPTAIDDVHDAINDYRDTIHHRTAIINISDVTTTINTAVASQADAAVKIEVARQNMIDALAKSAIAQDAAGSGTSNVSNALAPKTTAANPAPAAAPGDGTVSATDPSLASVGIVTPVEAKATAAALSSATPLAPDPVTKADPETVALAGAVANLDLAIDQALRAMPSPTYTEINTQIAGCKAGLS